MEKDRETFRAQPWVSRMESNKFSHIPGETRLSPSPFLPSVSLTKKSSTFGLRGFVQATQGTRGIKFVLESKFRINSIAIRCKSSFITIVLRISASATSLSLSLYIYSLTRLRAFETLLGIDKLQTFPSFFSSFPWTIKPAKDRWTYDTGGERDKSDDRSGQLKKSGNK